MATLPPHLSPADSSRRRQTVAGAVVGSKASASPPADPSRRRQTMAGFGSGSKAPPPASPTGTPFYGKAAALAGGKPSRLGRTSSAGSDAPATSHWSISAVAPSQAAPATACTDIIHATLMALPQSPCCELTISTPPATVCRPSASAASPPASPLSPFAALAADSPPAALRLRTAAADSPPAAPLATSTAPSETTAAIDRAIDACIAEFFGASVCAVDAVAAVAAVGAWPTVDLELTAEEVSLV